MELNQEILEQKMGLTELEILEVLHALYYEKYCRHGTTVHTQLLLIAKLAYEKGFRLGDDNISVEYTVDGDTFAFLAAPSIFCIENVKAHAGKLKNSNE